RERGGSNAIHSVVDTTNEILLLYGIHRSNQKPIPTIHSGMDVKSTFGVSSFRC
ncbi:MAG: hypothetical protein QOG79_6674, partial [Mycobacterium sp.]|nr:hypothetical protein [Mycobacterium sp.]